MPRAASWGYMLERFVVGGGCYWCFDAIYRGVRGVSRVEVGFAGGAVANPTLEQVSTGSTGHAEVVRVTFDTEEVSPTVILDIFFAFHDPTQLDRQWDDVGTHYRSTLLYETDDQKKLFEEAVEKAAEIWDAPIVTRIEPLATFYPAEESQQDFFAKNPDSAYCQAKTAPKLVGLRKAFARYLVS
jgi:peptide-methionine (S)-S-oxide reductase